VARAGRGVELHASDHATADEAAARLIAASASPVLVGVTVGGSAVLAAAPKRPRDVFAGQPLVMTLELEASGGTLEVAARLAGSKEQWIWRMEIPAAASHATPLPLGAHHGREVIADLESDEVLNDPGAAPYFMRKGGCPDADEEIERVAMRHRIVSRRTSLVAIAEEVSVDPLAPRRRERLAIELPAGVSAEGVGLERSYGLDHLQRGLSSMVQPTSAMSRGFRSRAVSLGREFLREAHVSRAASIGSDRHHLTATVVHIDGPEAILEFEAPVDGFYLPTGDLMLWLAGKKMGKVRVIDEKSSAQGPHAPGLLVRLALRLEKGLEWPAGEDVMLRWEGADNQEFFLTLAVPAEADRTP
jgi:hypothetical protein